MKQRTETSTVAIYKSDITGIESANPKDKELIEWADSNPQVWRIVRENRSKAFGRKSSDHYGWARAREGDSAACILGRVQTLHKAKHPDKYALARGTSFWDWRIKFTLEHYYEKDFQGGFFQQWDGRYDRGCCNLDFTVGTLDDVVKHFIEWCNTVLRYDTYAIKIDKKIYKRFKEDPILVEDVPFVLGKSRKDDPHRPPTLIEGSVEACMKSIKVSLPKI
jgi:hypothetical protein